MSTTKQQELPAFAGSVVKISQGQANAAELQVVCRPIDDRTLAGHARSAHVALYMAFDGNVGPAQHRLRAIITSINQAATLTGASEEQIARIARQRQAIAQETHLAVYAGIGTLDVDGAEIHALLVYCAPPATEQVKVGLPITWLCPTFRSAVH